MSIIYDALQKVGQNIDEKTVSLKRKNTLPKFSVYIIYAAVVMLGFLAANTLFNKARPLNSGMQNVANAKNNTQTLAQAPAAKLTEGAIKINNLASVSLTTAATESPAPVQTAPAPSLPNLTLNGLFFSGDEGFAIINNQIVREGDFIEGAQIKRISLSAVSLDFQGQDLKLANNK